VWQIGGVSSRFDERHTDSGRAGRPAEHEALQG
jgi:hypothetical protein